MSNIAVNYTNSETMANSKIMNQGCADFTYSQNIQNMSSRDIEEDIEIAEEYIENEVGRLFMEEANQQFGNEENVEPVAGPLVAPGEVYVDIVEDSTDQTFILHPCEVCEGIFTSTSELSSHVCQKKTNKNNNNVTEIIEIEDDDEDERNGEDSSEESQTDKDGFKVPFEVIRDGSGKEYRKVRETLVHVPRAKAKFVYNRKDKGPHECPVCKKTLSRLSGLTVHMRRHNGEYPFDCDLCKKKFVCNYDLDRHMLTHGRGKIFSYHCDICRQPFVSKAGMLQHKQKEHNKSNTPVDDTILVWTPPIDLNPPKKMRRKTQKSKKNINSTQKKDQISNQKVVNIIDPNVQYVLIYPN